MIEELIETIESLAHKNNFVAEVFQETFVDRAYHLFLEKLECLLDGS